MVPLAYLRPNSLNALTLGAICVRQSAYPIKWWALPLHPIREELIAVFALEDGLKVVGHAGDGEEACLLYKQLCPDILILDLRMPKKARIEVVIELTPQKPGPVYYRVDSLSERRRHSTRTPRGSERRRDMQRRTRGMYELNTSLIRRLNRSLTWKLNTSLTEDGRMPWRTSNKEQQRRKFCGATLRQKGSLELLCKNYVIRRRRT
jgi:hypothetical protein